MHLSTCSPTFASTRVKRNLIYPETVLKIEPKNKTANESDVAKASMKLSDQEANLEKSPSKKNKDKLKLS